MADTTYDVIKRANETNRAAGIQQAVEGRRRVCFSVTLDLSTAQLSTSPLELAFPFRGFWVQTASDSTAQVNLVPNPKNEGVLNAAIPLSKNDFGKNEEIISGGYLYWTAQAGKTMTIFFFVDGEFRPGSLINTIAGGVTSSDGSAISTSKLDTLGNQTSVSVSTSATIVAPTDTDRKLLELYVPGPVVYGDSAVVSTPGSEIGTYFPGGILEWRNTAAIYMAAVSGTVRVSGTYHS